MSRQGTVGSEKKLLTGLSPGIKGSGNLGAAEGAIGQRTAVFTGKRYTLGDALIDYFGGHLGESVDVCLPGSEISALDGVVKKPENRVAVILIILGGVNTTLGGN